jgi:hypothetical protein
MEANTSDFLVSDITSVMYHVTRFVLHPLRPVYVTICLSWSAQQITP